MVEKSEHRPVKREQSASPLEHGGQPRVDDSGWPEGPDGVRRAPRRVEDETKNLGETNEEMARKQASGEIPLPSSEIANEEGDDHDRKGKKHQKR